MRCFAMPLYAWPRLPRSPFRRRQRRANGASRWSFGNANQAPLPELAKFGEADARDVGCALEADGFEATVKTDVKRRALYHAFAAAIAGSPDTVGLFYYVTAARAGADHYNQSTHTTQNRDHKIMLNGPFAHAVG